MEIKKDDLIPVHSQIVIDSDMSYYYKINGMQESIKKDMKIRLAHTIAETLLNNNLIDFCEDSINYGTKYCADVIIYKHGKDTEDR